VKGDLFHIVGEIDLGDAAEVGLTIAGQAVTFDVAGQKLTALGRSAALPVQGKRLKLEILVDRTSVEVFADDGRVSMSSCFLPKADAPALALHARGGGARVVSLAVQPLRPAWKKAKPD